ncbi:MAG: NAD(P)H-dependent glycerol-3-phosphate dehydrogenase [Planctomycetota bacterium]
MKIAVLGNGGFGTAMAVQQALAGRRVALWGHDPDYTRQIASTRRNPRYLEGVPIPESVEIGVDFEAVLGGADVVLMAIPTQHVRAAIAPMAHLLAARPAVSLAKGLEQGTGLRPTEVLLELCPEVRALALSGPSHGEELALGQPTAVVLAGDDPSLLVDLQEGLSTRSLRIYRNRDVLGTELCGALKNVMAIAAGIADGLGYGDNAKAAILARGIVEMARFGSAAGADAATFQGLAGVGDLAVTAFSRHGRNRAFGERIGKGETLQAILASTRKVAEGVWTSRVVVARAAEMGVEMPIAAAVERVLFEGLPPDEAVRSLMERDPKAET